jgi:hypothetical protein
MGQLRPKADDAVQSGPAGVSAAGGKGKCAASQAADQFQGGPLRVGRSHAMLRDLEPDIEAIRFDTGDGKSNCR